MQTILRNAGEAAEPLSDAAKANKKDNRQQAKATKRTVKANKKA
eukprot:COSAG01_NODE_63101_length_281_cov_0.884615_2_plen_43_part_01